MRTILEAFLFVLFLVVVHSCVSKLDHQESVAWQPTCTKWAMAGAVEYCTEWKHDSNE